MNFENLRIKDIELVVEYRNDTMHWVAKNRVNHIIGIQLEGSAVHEFSNQTFTIGDNCIYYLNQKDDYKVQVIRNCSAYSVHFTTYEPIDTDSFCIQIQNSSEIINLLDKIKYEHSLSHNGDVMALSYLYRLCGIYNELRRKKHSPIDMRIKNALDHMDLHFTEKNCLHHAVHISGISVRRFNDLFKMHYGTTPNRYIISKKIDLASQLLLNSFMSIETIALSCGFTDQYYFNKVFKSETGFTPAKYRNKRKSPKP